MLTGYDLPVTGPYAGPGHRGEVLPVKYEELTAPEFIKAVERSGGTCIVPLGIMEKHGPHLPLGTDLFVARKMAIRAAGKGYSVVFPEYFAGQITATRPCGISWTRPAGNWRETE